MTSLKIEKKKKSVEVKLELGHRAVMREKVTEEGFTHDWTVFVRGAEGHHIHFFVEKVVFHLHESFPKPKRVVKEPPYSVSESGYAGFIMPIDVYFRTREEPKKVTFRYDLYLRLESPPVSNIRIEKLTFQNPSDDFRQKLIKAGGLAGALSGSAAGGSASLSTQACAPPPHVEDHPPVVHPKAAVAEKKPRSHVASKEIKQPSQPPPPKPSQPFTDIFGAPIRTKNSPDPSSVKSSKDSGHSSQSKSKSSQNSSSKEGKSAKESHKIKESHHSKDSRHTAKESHHSSKDSHPPKDSLPIPKDESSQSAIKDNSTPTKEPVPQKEAHHTSKEAHKTKEHHSKEGSKKDSHHTSKEAKNLKESKPSDSKDSKSSKSIKVDKESNKTAVKRPAPTDSHGSHGNIEKKKKLSPVLPESSNKSSSHPKPKSKEGKEKSEKQKIKPLSNSLKKEEEKPKVKKSPAVAPAPAPTPPPPPLPPAPPTSSSSSVPPEPKEMPKAPKPTTPKQPSSPPPPPPTVAEKPPSPPPKSPPFHDSSMDSDSDDESHKSPYIRAHYSSAASSISESSLHSNMPGLSDQSIISPLSDDDDDDDTFLPPSKKKANSEYDLENGNEVTKPVEKPVEKIVENRPMPKLNKKSHHKSSKHSKPESFHQGNGTINDDVSVHRTPSPPVSRCSPSPKACRSPSPIMRNNSNNAAYREELLELQRLIMSSEDRKLLQNIVDLIEQTGKYEITKTTFDFDLCMLDKSIIQKIKLCVANCDSRS